MSKKRPPGVTVFAILNIVFGSLGLLCSFCGVVGLLSQNALQGMQAGQQGQPGQPKFDLEKYYKDVEAKAPGLMVSQWARLGTRLILSIGLLVAGIGLLGMKAGGRLASIICGGLLLLVELGGMIYSVLVESPAVADAMKQQGMAMPGGLLAGLSMIGPGIIMVYAITMLIFMLMPGTAQAFAGYGSGGYGDSGGEDFYDADFQRDRRDPPPGG